VWLEKEDQGQNTRNKGMGKNSHKVLKKSDYKREARRTTAATIEDAKNTSITSRCAETVKPHTHLHGLAIIFGTMPDEIF